MKKTIAAGGASVLGLAAVSLGAAPAHAADDPVVDLCASDEDHVATIGGLSSNWYMDCIPQYALTQVEFEVDTTGLPDAFGDITAPGVTITANGSTTAAPDYFGHPSENAVADVYFDGDEWIMQAYLRVDSVEGVLPAELPDNCAGGTYTSAFMVNYAPQAIAFTQTIDDVEVTYEVALTPAPLFLGLNILDDGQFDSESPQCAVSGASSAFGATGDDFSWSTATWVATWFPQSSVTLTPYFGNGKDLGVITPTAPEPEPEEPALPATGTDPAGTIGLAAMFLALGVAGGYLRRRQSRA